MYDVINTIPDFSCVFFFIRTVGDLVGSARAGAACRGRKYRQRGAERRPDRRRFQRRAARHL